MLGEFLRGIAAALDVSGVPYMLTGSVASSMYGVPRATNDIDDFSVTEFDRRETHEIEGMRLTIAAPEDVLIAKLEWSKIGDSERQLLDAAGILRMQAGKLDVEYIERWVQSLGLEAQWADVRRRETSRIAET